MKLAKTAVLAAFVVLSASALAQANKPLHAFGDPDECWTQFQQCTAKGWPTYKCRDLYDLCESGLPATLGLPGALDIRKQPAL